MSNFWGPPQNAPQGIADTLVTLQWNVSVFNNYSLILFRADGTYQVIVSQGVTNSAIGLQTNPPASGTYTYTAIPAGSGFNGTITFTSGSPGYQSVEFGDGFYSEGTTFVDVYPRIALTGAVNVSNNSWISTGHPSEHGFVIEGNSPRWVLIRGAGPSLSQFAVPNPVTSPTMNLSSAIKFGVNVTNPFPQATGDHIISPWSTDPNLVAGLQAIFSIAGAFQFPSESSDCAGLLLLSPGAYVVQGSTSSSGGQLLAEVYILPYGS